MFFFVFLYFLDQQFYNICSWNQLPLANTEQQSFLTLPKMFIQTDAFFQYFTF